MIELILFCIGTASFSSFLDMTFQKGMIFRKYYSFITYWLFLPKKWNYLQSRGEPGSKIVSFKIVQIYTRNKYQWLWKILGGCVYCFSAWVYIVLFLAVVLQIQPLSHVLIGFILGLGLNHVFIKAIEKI